MNTQAMMAKKASNDKIVMVTCYDYWSAKILNDTDVDCILIGDSGSIVMHGDQATISATTDMMAMYTQAVSRGCTNKLLIADMPFMSYRRGFESAMDSVQKLIQAGASAVKLEGAKGNLELIEHIIESGVPVMGHLGLTPQKVHQLGGYKVQGKTQASKEQIFQDAISLDKAGCFAIVLECLPSSLAKEITEQVSCPVIGIGAGVETDGQVLVLHDLLGCFKDFKPKFVKQYMDGAGLIQQAVNSFAQEVKHLDFPNKDHEYS